MRAIIESIPGVVLCCALAVAGNWLVASAGLPVPGAVIGMLAYAFWLMTGRAIGWSRPGALLLTRWIGAMIVPALVALQALAVTLAGAALTLLVVLVVTTLLTALVTALLYRLAGGRR